MGVAVVFCQWIYTRIWCMCICNNCFATNPLAIMLRVYRYCIHLKYQYLPTQIRALISTRKDTFIFPKRRFLYTPPDVDFTVIFASENDLNLYFE